MLPLIQKEVVDNKKWITEEEIIDVFAIAQAVPGVIAVNTAVFIGKKTGGLAGSIAAVFGTVLPAFLSIIIILVLLTGLRTNKYVDKVFSGIRAASAALILLSAIKLGKSAVKGKTGWIIAAAAFLMIAVFNLSAVWAILTGGAAGYVLYLLKGRERA